MDIHQTLINVLVNEPEFAPTFNRHEQFHDDFNEEFPQLIAIRFANILGNLSNDDFDFIVETLGDLYRSGYDRGQVDFHSESL